MSLDRDKLGQTLASLREAAGLSQQQVADRVGLSRSSIANIERGGQNPTADGLAAITAALGATVSAAMDDGGTVQILARIASAQRDIAEAVDQLAMLVQQLSGQTRQLADDLALIPRDDT